MKTNNSNQIQQTRTAAWLPTLVGVGLLAASVSFAMADDNRRPEVPEDIAAPDNVKVHFHGFALGHQIYTWDGVSWGAAVPRATLFDDEGNFVADHFGSAAGPVWQSPSLSQVVGLLPPKRANVDDTAIPWLLLEANRLLTFGNGILAETTHIHRVNTVGGKEPSTPGERIGQVAEVPYMADYFFYRASNDGSDAN